MIMLNITSTDIITVNIFNIFFPRWEKSIGGLFSLQILKVGLILFAGWVSIKSGLAKGSRLVVFFVSLFLLQIMKQNILLKLN